MFQQLSVIKKTKTRVDHYFNSNGYTLIHNLETNDLTLIFGNDGLCGVTSLEEGLKMIGWDYEKEIKIENISWI